MFMIIDHSHLSSVLSRTSELQLPKSDHRTYVGSSGYRQMPFEACILSPSLNGFCESEHAVGFVYGFLLRSAVSGVT
jgi:hypothetical protein